MQEQSTQLIQQVFSPEITAQGLADLRKKYPSNVVYDMSEDEQFKRGKAARAERNKLKEGFKRARIDFNKKLAEEEDSLSKEVDAIYAPIIESMEREEKRRKELAEKAKREKEEQLAKERNEINQIRNFVSDCQNKDAQYIADTIESVDLIDTGIFSKDLIHEAIEAKKQTLNTLMMMLSDTKAREKFEKEQAELNAQKSLMNLKSYASNCIGKTPAKIERKLEALRELPILESEYGDYLTEAADAKNQAMQLLEMMFEQAKQLEALQPKVEAPTLKPELPENAMLYTPMQSWPSDEVRELSPVLDQVCFKLEEAEQVIKTLEGLLNAA
ncbi:hypothetical protein HUZ36_04415 [Pseudoalteromonas sp. McH1-7]|uniref:hypothetical protein n=1 Tax=Pseudoalteromonas sp. McH1-7 TaxID=2745574 RepID=UPI001591D887|nr:hypothetical protein [Pseudoalteromonas sp. McH1-7]NUZ10016.1 hypothetical protein [Pseudoalteromonas sp. McH1-7]